MLYSLLEVSGSGGEGVYPLGIYEIWKDQHFLIYLKENPGGGGN